MIGVTYIACPACHRYTRNKTTGSCENEHCAAHRPDSANKRPHAVPDWYSRALDAQPKNAVPPFPTSVQPARPASVVNPATIKVAAPPIIVRPSVVASVPPPLAPATSSTAAAGESQTRIESEAPAVVARPAKGMNWKLVFLLAALGPMTALLFSQDFLRELRADWIPITLLALVIPLSCAGWIAKKAVARHFLHGFLVGFLFLASIAVYAIHETYQMYASAPTSTQAPLKTMVFTTLAGSTIVGLYFGFFAAIAIRLARRQWWKVVKVTLLFLAVFAAIFKIGETIGR